MRRYETIDASNLPAGTYRFDRDHWYYYASLLDPELIAMSYGDSDAWKPMAPHVKLDSVISDNDGDQWYKLAITPQKKELPKQTGFFSSLGPWGALLNIIPVVGQVLYIATTVGQVAEASDFNRKFKRATDGAIDTSPFAPQFKPATFYIQLPKAQAEIVLSKPWLIEHMVIDFYLWLEEATAYDQLHPTLTKAVSGVTVESGIGGAAVFAVVALFLLLDD